MYLKLPPPSSGVYDKCVEIQLERVVSAHSPFCSWSTTQCPETFCRVDTDLNNIRMRAKQLEKLGNKLPCLEEEVVHMWEDVLEVGSYAICS